MNTARASNSVNCYPAVYIDGALAREGADLAPSNVATCPRLDDLVRPYVIRAIEIYDSPASIPVEFSALGALCGVIVIWTVGGS